MKKDKIFTRSLDGRIIEIGNWEARTSDNDAFVGMPLSDSGLEQLRRGREQGKTDRQIFYDIHKKQGEGRRPVLSVGELTVQQLARLISDLIGEDLETLNKMSKKDLIQMVKRLARLRHVKLGFDLNLDA